MIKGSKRETASQRERNILTRLAPNPPDNHMPRTLAPKEDYKGDKESIEKATSNSKIRNDAKVKSFTIS